eukprot:GHUV01030701.1.p2 GENE.GHUV01030701.1~~GHUV01030701.1.p2  ORF type:complete len:107 (+),score=22.78 GHUV01030701.1:206-526(+)
MLQPLVGTQNSTTHPSPRQQVNCLTADIAPANSLVCNLCLMTSVGTRVNDAAAPAAAPATTGPSQCRSSLLFLYTHCFTGSYTAMKMADEGATPGGDRNNMLKPWE